MFRNVRFYRLDGSWPDSEEALSKSLEKAGFEPCGPLTERSSGWVEADPDNSELLARRINGADLLRLRSQSRVLPPAVINEELETRIEDFRQRIQEAPSPRDKRRMKAEARDELMPKAMLRSDRIWCYVDLKERVLGIDALRDSAAERAIRRLQPARSLTVPGSSRRGLPARAPHRGRRRAPPVRTLSQRRARESRRWQPMALKVAGSLVNGLVPLRDLVAAL